MERGVAAWVDSSRSSAPAGWTRLNIAEANIHACYGLLLHVWFMMCMQLDDVLYVAAACNAILACLVGDAHVTLL